MKYLLKFVAYGSSEYEQAIQLRYHLFYEEHGIDMASVLMPREQSAKHCVVLRSNERMVLAYGQLHRKNNSEHQIYQMVVEPSYQRQGLGSLVLQELIKTACHEKGNLLMLSARATYTEFYERFGFETDGAVFPSSSTGIPHVKMIKRCDRISS